MKALMLVGLMMVSMVLHAYDVDEDQDTVMVCTNDGQGCRVIIVYPM